MSPLLAATETERVSVHADKFQQRLCHTLTAPGVGTTDRQLHWGDSGGSEDKPSSWPYLKEEATSLSLMVVSERRQMATRCSWDHDGQNDLSRDKRCSAKVWELNCLKEKGFCCCCCLFFCLFSVFTASVSQHFSCHSWRTTAIHKG